jgi:hypothetical protein
LNRAFYVCYFPHVIAVRIRSNPRHCRANIARRVICLLVSLIAAAATTFVLIQKVAKNQVIRNASLPHKAIALQNQSKPGLLPFHAASLAHVPRFSKKPLCPAITHRPPSFCLISSEAVLLTGKKDNFFLPYPLTKRHCEVRSNP